ncbi:MAG: hypothetical protein E7455_06810 [Ruminococcaceae bacterium]|nr:hypothetical protein [Oscillospiraceae bacterium]
MIFWYKNSFLASVLSIFGCAMAMAGIVSFSEDAELAVILLVIGVVFAIWGKQISNNKAFKKWWKQIEDNNLETAIAQDLNTAVATYQKNPQQRTIKKIAALNPAFAEHIRKNIANKK